MSVFTATALTLPPGSKVWLICIAGTAYDQIGKKLALGYEFLGEQTLKNIAKPIRVYRVLMEPELAGMVIDKDKRKPGVSWRNVLLPALVRESERALELNPNDARIHASLGAIMNYFGRPDDAIAKLETALRLDPKMIPGYYMHLGLAYYLKRRYDDAISTLNRGLGWYPDFVFIWASCHANADRGRVNFQGSPLR